MVSGASPSPASSLPPAGFWRRFVAATVDLIVYVPVYYTIIAAFGPEHRWAAEWMFAFVALFSYAWFFACPWLASPGMRLMGIIVLTDRGVRLSYLQSVIWGIVSSVGLVIACAPLYWLMLHYPLMELQTLQHSPEFQTMEPDMKIAALEHTLGAPPFVFLKHLALCLLASLALLLAWALSVACTRRKTGLHNLIAKTRFHRAKADAIVSPL